jgi:glycerophosphoryl diester phosphodiesterase
MGKLPDPISIIIFAWKQIRFIMIIISHRGCWNEPGEKNSLNSFIRSATSGFGCETDIRDHNSELVISHDVPGNINLSLNPVLGLFENKNLLLAINIKSDGLQYLLQKSLKQFNITNYFVFDMSVPETRKYVSMGFNVFGRQSEFESEIPFYNEIKGVWIDSFERTWYNEDLVNKHLMNGKQVCIVSSELHDRDYSGHWEFLKSFGFIRNDNLILCTDHPEDAQIYFN